jgi:archaellum component FlaC
MPRQSFEKNKPIEEVMENLESLMIDIKGIKTDIKGIKTDIKGIKTELIHIKEYIRKLEVREQLEEDKLKQIENEYVKPENGWFF